MNYNSTDSVAEVLAEKANSAHLKLDENIEWLKQQMSPYFLRLNQDESDALSLLATSLHRLENYKRLTLVDRPECLMLAQIDEKGSLYRTLHNIPLQKITYLEITTSFGQLPNSEMNLEVVRCNFNSTGHRSDDDQQQTEVPAETIANTTEAMKVLDDGFDVSTIPDLLGTIWNTDREYVRLSPVKRIARLLRLYSDTENNGGIYLRRETTSHGEYRISFGVTNPPHAGFVVQLLEVFQRLNISVKRSYAQTIDHDLSPCFLATFYVKPRDEQPLNAGSPLYATLKRELYNTQILSTGASSYRALVETGLMTGNDATLITAMIGFCHTNLAHSDPDLFDLENIMPAFHNNPSISGQLLNLFYTRFNPEIDTKDRKSDYEAELTKTLEMVESFNSGRRKLDSFRRTIFSCATSFIRFCLKTNFFVPEKHALAFRLDPKYLETLDASFTNDLPTDRPFRITYFSGRRGSGYHIGFSDIARGGWRTLITQSRDDYITSASTIFKENYVLAHTQHLKNKDIYEGGSKMVAILNIDPRSTAEQRQQYLYKLQFGFINAFLDLYITENGLAKDLRVVDYYGQDEPIELGPDENMHNVMIELIAKTAKERGYVLGTGIMSSKQVGINHKDYGVTSIGVIRFAEVTMKSLGIDMHQDRFSVKFTGGPNGDVAGNGMRLLYERCPNVAIKLIIDGTGALFDPEGLDKEAMSKVILKTDLDGFDTSALHVGGFMIYRMQTRKEDMSVMYRKLIMTESGIEEEWISTDAFYKLFNNLVFTVETDLFIPAGGRPETIDASNAERFFLKDGTPSSSVIVEGANSFITPKARTMLQQNGVVIMRDASANKCGVISSSYEIIANLMLSEEEFLANKDEYVDDVIVILNRMAEQEAEAILLRYKQQEGAITYTDLSNKISREINSHYARMFEFFQANPERCNQPNHISAILNHMPSIIRDNKKWHERIDRLPKKVTYAILASKLASAMVYAGNDNSLYEDLIDAQLKRIK
ncbi:NAD-glutamate dehydrogenase domain-containing protein [Leucothrix arctica]|uniref:Amino acid dehydrogenase n=1 Tax=Leucothrix arctica TaxID=1481894 RepID=A0A317CFN4_9GAMM|nr:NAD-glutamate dehydrogenase domain-containing protein [Leucothrix arctica]PWQ94982.1 amino acid dehydrogenase [Leucothrix arctica]